ncbi:uncharacterized protein DC041_0002240 [Schistosoma bovis]|uniref:Uncharacterized protein n=1 Tax=Schistosoma bovis TaxID=6184 RepID=A0A430Q2J2_SCHBO|nr:uncharacterized protein DC041_0002240 [Schistosoma bovis]
MGIRHVPSSDNAQEKVIPSADISQLYIYIYVLTTIFYLTITFIISESVFCLDFDSTGKFLASGGQDHIAIIWNATTGEIEFICQGRVLLLLLLL